MTIQEEKIHNDIFGPTYDIFMNSSGFIKISYKIEKYSIYSKDRSPKPNENILMTYDVYLILIFIEIFVNGYKNNTALNHFLSSDNIILTKLWLSHPSDEILFINELIHSKNIQCTDTRYKKSLIIRKFKQSMIYKEE